MVFRSSSTSAPTAFVSCIAWCCLFIFAFTSLPQAHARTADEWRSRSIYQLITDRFARTDGSTTAPCDPEEQMYCGGTFEGIMNHLDYIQGMGFTAIWISPVVQNIPETTEYGQAYHGFWTKDINKINEHFGTVETLKALVEEVHRRDMYIMIDVVVNNVAVAGNASSTTLDKVQPPFNDKKYFHKMQRITDYGNQVMAQDGWLAVDFVSLPDLDTESDYVQNVWHTWVREMVANYSLDGLRIDAAKHVNKPFWAPFQAAADTFTMAEVFTDQSESPNRTCDWSVDALSSVLNFPTWYQINQALGNSSNAMGGLGYMVKEVSLECHDSTILGTFAENHDVKRFANSSSDLSQQKSALVHTLMGDGIPIVYYGSEHAFHAGGDPGNREALWLNPTGYDTTAPLYQTIKTLNMVRNAVNKELDGIDYTNWSGYWAFKIKPLFITKDILAYRKGYDTSVITVLTNVGVGGGDVGPYHMGDTNMVENDVIIDVLSCNHTLVGPSGEFDLTLKNGEPQVWVPARYLLTTEGFCTDLMKQLNRSGATGPRKSGASSNSLLQPHVLALYIGSICFGAIFVLFAG